MAMQGTVQYPSSVQAITPVNDAQRGWGSASTYSTALTAISSKADVYNSGPPVTSTPTTGLCLVQRPAGSVVLATVIGKANNGTLNFRVWGWYRIANKSAMDSLTSYQWTARPLALIAVTLGAKTGVSGGIVDATTVYADTMTVTTDYGPSPLGVRIVGPATPDDSTVWAMIDPLGADYIELEGTLSGGSATEFDFLVRGASGV